MLNKVMIIGRLGRDPELKYTQSGKACASLNIATDESYTDRNGNRQNKTEWHRVIAWDKAAESCERFLVKGSLVYVEGKIQTREWQDPQGQKRYVMEIRAERIQFLDRRKDDGGQSRSNPEPSENMDDCPF